MGALDQLLGALLLGTWLASILYGMVVIEAFKYFTLCSDDSWSRKSLMIVTLGFCTAALIGDYGTAYFPTVTFWGDVQGLATVFWSLPLSSFANTVLASIVDCYLVYRLYTLSKNIWSTLFLYALILLALGGYLVVFVLLSTGRSITHRSTLTIGAVINFTSVAVVGELSPLTSSSADKHLIQITDVLTAAGLIWKLRTMRSSFPQTNTFLNRVMTGALQTGSITAVCSLLILATFLNNPDTDISTFFMFQFGPLYTLTLLFNFNLRRGPDSLGARTSGSRTGVTTNTMHMDGIHVHRTAVVTIDPIDTAVGASHRRLDDLEECKRDLKHDSDEPLGARTMKN
ncbi:hypothetical protein C8R47DRAFT_1315786 [Mycena vitilis]|nr:hypothetical protein C8R47DRAFT_1315786 [Mycena vitilis]